MSQSAKNIDKELDSTFYEKTLRPDRQQSYKLIAKYIKKQLYPDANSVVDYGCGAGWFLHWLKYYGVTDIYGIEPNKNAKSVMAIAVQEAVKIRGLTRKITLKRDFDLAMCIEVLEHIDEKHADAAIDNITRHTNKLIFSAATPGQGGWGHINEQPFDYWKKKLKHKGFAYKQLETLTFRAYLNNKKAKKWYCNNIAVFERV
jgi:2-polyprenyl-3-methyl-5-hydroxy-6-metoxy-1,4-benzoquinol methylase